MRDHVASMSGERPPEVLGSLPRTRPHRRSQKRPARPPHTEPAAAKPSTAKTRAAKTGAAKPRAGKPQAAGPQPARLRQPAQPAGSPPGPRVRRPAPSNGSDVLGTAVQAAAELAEIGLTVGARAIRGAVARLPRP
jgi:hypothetical protein